MNLLIVESPHKAKTIKDFMGAGWNVVASVGHIRELPAREMGVSAPDFKPHYEVMEDKESVVARIKSLVATADNVFLGTDADREGEAIAWHLKEVLRLKSPQRIRFREITQKAIKQAIATPTAIDVKMVASQEARRVVDRLVGYTVSPALSQIFGRRGLSAGRVQSIAVRIIVDRENAIRTFITTNYYSVLLTFDDWTAEWDSASYLPQDQKYQLDKNLAEKVSEIRSVTVIDFAETVEKKSPSAPFITSTLQQIASSKLKFPPKKTMQLAQRLYDGGYITYMRADNPNLSDEALMMIYQVCQLKGYEMVESPRKWKTPTGSQEAHECIRPCDFSMEEAGDDADEKALYRLIWQRAVASQLAPATYAVRTITLQSDEMVSEQKPIFIAKGRKLINSGWKSVYLDDDKEQEDMNNPVPSLNIDERLNEFSAKLQAKKTRAPSRFSMAELVKELERLGIGRPSTYASIIDTIERRGYVEMDASDKYLIPTQSGEVVAAKLVESKFSFMDFAFTREMEAKLDEIAEGNTSYKEIVSAFYHQLDDEMKNLSKGNTTQLPPDHPCPTCGKALFRKKSDKGFFWGCSGYPECKTTLPDAKGQPGKKKELKKAKAPCPLCGKELVQRKKLGKDGFDFWGCSGYPTCNARYPNVNGQPDLTKK